mgnify:CR=1 FL=1
MQSDSNKDYVTLTAGTKRSLMETNVKKEHPAKQQEEYNGSGGAVQSILTNLENALNKSMPDHGFGNVDCHLKHYSVREPSFLRMMNNFC